ncbi:unnamed protein product [Angiostrongylus costaricensis]|uniref:Peptidase C1A papain C-terminal domain-containing protein n=1 Tax=Angiostrongylus costaricensis TaxID=334426 RepID=A0A3P7HJD6_ANGCS|nr:unnamed protein product [Angiostrongylus costaricensis]
MCIDCHTTPCGLAGVLKWSVIFQPLPLIAVYRIFLRNILQLQKKHKKCYLSLLGQCGSCWAFAAVASVESAHAIAKGPLVRLSEQELIDCDTQNYGCNGGYRPYAMSFVRKNGLVKEDEYPYRGADHNECALDVNSTGRVFIHDYRTLSPNEEIIADWIATKGPVTFGMNVTKPLYSYRNGIFSPSKEDCEKNSLGSHALIFVGYGTDSGGERYWLVKNSWGSRWGQNGYFKLARGQNACGAANSVVTPIIEQN